MRIMDGGGGSIVSVTRSADPRRRPPRQRLRRRRDPAAVVAVERGQPRIDRPRLGRRPSPSPATAPSTSAARYLRRAARGNAGCRRPRALVDPNRTGSIGASACFGDSGGPVTRGGELVGIITRAAHPSPRIACGDLTRWAAITVSGEPRETVAAGEPDDARAARSQGPPRRASGGERGGHVQPVLLVHAEGRSDKVSTAQIRATVDRGSQQPADRKTALRRPFRISFISASGACSLPAFAAVGNEAERAEPAGE